MAGLEATRSRGRKGGRPPGLTKEALATARNKKILYDSGERTVQEIAESLEISRATCYRYINIIREMEKKKLTKER